MASMKDLFTYPNGLAYNFTNETYYAGLFTAGYFVTGNKYQITTVGTTDFTAIGAANNNVDTIFTASGAGSGTGTAYDIGSGLLGRFHKLKDETYISIPGSLSVSTTDQLMQATSRFVNYFDNIKDSANSFNVYDIYNWPILQGNLRVISAQDITGAVSSGGETTLTFGSAHGFSANDQVLCSGFNGAMAQLNGQVLFVVLVDATNVKLSFTTGGGDIYNPADLTANILGVQQHVDEYYQSTQAGASTTIQDTTVAIDITDWAGTENVTDLADGTGVLVNSVANNGTSLATNTYYSKSAGGDLYELYEDASLTNPLKSSELTGFTSDDVIGYATVNTPMQTMSISVNSNPNDIGATAPQTFFAKGEPYEIIEVGTTDFTAIGASANTVGVKFISTADNAPGTGMVRNTRVGPYREVSRADLDTVDPVDSTTDDWFWSLKTTTSLSEKQRFIRADISDQAAAIAYPRKNYTTGTFYNSSVAVQKKTAIQNSVASTTFLKTKRIADKNYNISYDAAFNSWTADNFFNKYTLLEHDSNGVVTMNLLSQLAGSYSTILNGTEPYPFGMLSDLKWKFSKKCFHNVQMFDGWGFTRTTGTVDVPTAGTITNQAGKPVIDPVDVYCKVDNNRVWISGNNAFNTTENSYTSIWGMPNAYEGQVVLWDPSATIENYRTDVTEFENLNIMSKSGGSYSVNEFTTQSTANAVADDTKPAVVTHISTNTNKFNSLSLPDGAHYILALSTNALNDWLGTSYSNGDTFTIKLSPCPHTGISQAVNTGYDIGHFLNIDEYEGYTAAGAGSGIYYDSSSLYPYDMPLRVSASPGGTRDNYEVAGIASRTPYFAPGQSFLRHWPHMFVCANPVTFQSQDFGNLNVTFKFASLSVATTGNLAPSGDLIYELDTVTVVNPGAQIYSYTNSSNATAFGAEIKTDYWNSGGTSARVYASTGETKPTVAITVDGSGYWSGATLNGSARGRFSLAATGGDPVLLPLKALDDAYTPRTPSIAETEDTQYDSTYLQDYWVDPSYNINKTWPINVKPSAAKISYNQPSTVNISQSGKKFVRTSGITRWQIEAEYPPMKKEDFDKFHKVVLAVQGQNIPFYFIIDPDNQPLFWNSGSHTVSTTEPRVLEVDTTKNIFTVGGFESHENPVFEEGEIVISPNTNNGQLATVINRPYSNIFGETKIRFSHPTDISASSIFGRKLYKDPYHAVCTLGDDSFHYSITTDGYYYISVKFDLDYWK